jgi:hemerythrin-like domain-containing protein
MRAARTLACSHDQDHTWNQALLSITTFTMLENRMSAVPASPAFETLLAQHQHIHEHLHLLAALAKQVEAQGVDAQVQQQAGAIEAFFSGTARQHHAQEEQTVFQPLLSCADGELSTAIRKLQQDHGWLEENWIELAPQLRALAAGNHWVDASELQHDLDVFLELYREHLTQEEMQVYPALQAGAGLL